RRFFYLPQGRLDGTSTQVGRCAAHAHDSLGRGITLEAAHAQEHRGQAWQLFETCRVQRPPAPSTVCVAQSDRLRSLDLPAREVPELATFAALPEVIDDAPRCAQIVLSMNLGRRIEESRMQRVDVHA